MDNQGVVPHIWPLDSHSPEFMYGHSSLHFDFVRFQFLASIYRFLKFLIETAYVRKFSGEDHGVGSGISSESISEGGANCKGGRFEELDKRVARMMILMPVRTICLMVFESLSIS